MLKKAIPEKGLVSLCHIGTLACAILWFGSAHANADPTNYQRYVIGERALGMGGAQTAAVNDPMANLYNPAAMVFTTSTMVSASKCLYSFDSRKIDGGYVPRSSFVDSGESVDALNLSHKNDLTLPSTLALSTKFGKRLYDGGPNRHAIGVAVLVPNQDSFTYYGKWSAKGSNSDRESYALSESYTQIWTGLSYAFRISKQLGIGLSGFLVTASSERNMNLSRYGDTGACALEDCGFMEFKESHLSIDTVSLLFRVGGLWEPHENWRFGLVVSAPSILLGDLKLFSTKGDLRQIHGTASVEGDADDRVEYFSDTYKLKVATREPVNLRAGAAFLWNESVTIDLDLSFHFPINYRKIKGDPVLERRCPKGLELCGEVFDETASPEWYDSGIMKSVERKPVVNFNIGWELILDGKWTLRNGVFTDFSSAPSVRESEKPQDIHIDRYGAGFSVGFKSSGYDVSLGVAGSIGYGHAAVYNPHEDPVWQPARAQERALYIFIAGIQQAAVKGSKKLVKKAEQKISEKSEQKEDEQVR